MTLADAMAGAHTKIAFEPIFAEMRKHVLIGYGRLGGRQPIARAGIDHVAFDDVD